LRCSADKWLLWHCGDEVAERIYRLIALVLISEIRVPVTAKLSRKFYERLGDDIATELVDWFNAVDATYQTQLKEMNDLNWERFKSHLDAELAKVRAEMSTMRADLITWMFLFWIGNAGLLLGLRFFAPK